MKKVFFIFEYSDVQSGAPISDFTLLKGLQERGFSVKVLLTKGTIADKQFVDVLGSGNVLYPKFGEVSIRLSNLFSTFKNFIGVFLTMRPYLKDYYFFSDGATGQFFISLLFWTKLKNCFISRGGYLNNHTWKFLKLFFGFVCKWVAVTEVQRERIIKLGVPAENIFVIYNGCERSLLAKNRCPSRPIRLAILGCISVLKNQELGIRLVKLLKDEGIDAELNLYGNVSRSGVDCGCKEKLCALIKELDLEKSVNFRGFSNKKDEIFENIDILLSASWQEGFGRTIVEAMFRDTPVIAYAGAGGPRDILKNNETGFLVEENTPEAFLKCVKKLLSDNVFVENMIKRARKDAENRFTIEKMIENYACFLGKL